MVLFHTYLVLVKTTKDKPMTGDHNQNCKSNQSVSIFFFKKNLLIFRERERFLVPLIYVFTR